MGDESYQTVSSLKIINQLGWSVDTTLEEGLGKTIGWYKNNTDWLDEIQKEYNIKS